MCVQYGGSRKNSSPPPAPKRGEMQIELTSHGKSVYGCGSGGGGRGATGRGALVAGAPGACFASPMAANNCAARAKNSRRFIGERRHDRRSVGAPATSALSYGPTHP